MSLPRWLPASLARRFALAAAGLAAAALLLTSMASWWLINRQHEHAVQKLADRETQFRAISVGSDLKALAMRMAEIAGSTILATGLVDSAGRETYLAPFLGGIRQINGIPVQVMFTDFQGTEIASNGGARFSAEQLAWLRRSLNDGRASAEIFASADGGELVAMEPMIYARTTSPEGAVLYKVLLRDINVGPSMTLQWGATGDTTTSDAGMSIAVPVPAVFQPLGFRVHGRALDTAATPWLPLPYLHVAGIALALFTVLAIGGMRLARLLTLDLRRLEAFSSRLVGSGLSTERALENGSAEVASLAHSINDMLERLNEQHVILLREREKLTRLTEALQAADQRKDAFLAMLGHELRNPLAPISAGAELLRRLPLSDPRVVRTSEVIARQVGHMTKIVSDLLDVSRVTRGLITLDKAAVDIAEVVNAAVEQVHPLIESRRHRMRISPLPERVFVLGDHARLVQVLGNLLTNAAKYTPEGGHIDVQIEADQSSVRVAVRDDGVGMSRELIPEIFDLFTQGSRAADRSQGGLGLGLALVKHLVGLHGGTIDAASGGIGHGSTFTFQLPRLPTPARAPERPAPPVADVGEELTVLVVDDNQDAAQTLAQWLALEGHVALVAGSAASALQQAREQHIDVFVLDIGLPGMDGIELARRLRAMPQVEGAVLIALTGYGQASDHEKSQAAGFDHHLVKPADLDVLQRLLRDAAHARVAHSEPAK